MITLRSLFDRARLLERGDQLPIDRDHSIALTVRFLLKEPGADDEARTRYLNLGKVALYQMSYVRVPIDVGYSNRSPPVCQAPNKKIFEPEPTA